MSESPHPRANELGSLSTRELLQLMHGEDRRAVEAVEAHLDAIAAAVEAIAERLRAGGRLHYFGAGTSGRLAALDAAECAPTFGVAPDLVQAHDAGDGEAEDDAGGAPRRRARPTFGRATRWSASAPAAAPPTSSPRSPRRGAPARW